jgi:hypothetical protein
MAHASTSKLCLLGAAFAERGRSIRCRDGEPASMMLFDQTDFSVVVKNRAPPPNPWRWEIYRAGRRSPVQQSQIYFDTMAVANRAGKEALKQLLEKLSA